MKKTPRGFVALMSVIIISAILLLYVFGLGASSFFARFDALDSENQRIARSAAESCVNEALLQIAQGTIVTGPVTKAGVTCSICSGTDATHVVTRAVHNASYSNIRATVSLSNGGYTISDWSEDANGDAACTL